jgi:hypothetical protein
VRSPQDTFFFSDIILNLYQAILIQGQQMGAGKPVGNDIYFLVIVKKRQKVLSPLQNLLGVPKLLVSGRQKGRPLVIPKPTYG